MTASPDLVWRTITCLLLISPCLARLRSQSESQANGVPAGRTLRPHSRYSQNSDGPTDITSLHGELKRDRESVQKWDVSVWNDGVNRHRGKRVKMDPVHAAQAQRPNPSTNSSETSIVTIKGTSHMSWFSQGHNSSKENSGPVSNHFASTSSSVFVRPESSPPPPPPSEQSETMAFLPSGGALGWDTLSKDVVSNNALEKLNKNIEESGGDFVLKMRAWEDRCRAIRELKFLPSSSSSVLVGGVDEDDATRGRTMRGKKRAHDAQEEVQSAPDCRAAASSDDDWEVVVRPQSVDSASALLLPTTLHEFTGTADPRLSPSISAFASDGGSSDVDLAMYSLDEEEEGEAQDEDEDDALIDVGDSSMSMGASSFLFRTPSSSVYLSSSSASTPSTSLSASVVNLDKSTWLDNYQHTSQSPLHHRAAQLNCDKAIDALASYMQSGGGGLDDDADETMVTVEEDGAAHVDAGALWS